MKISDELLNIMYEMEELGLSEDLVLSVMNVVEKIKVKGL